MARPYLKGKVRFTTKGVIAGCILIYCVGIVIACTSKGKKDSVAEKESGLPIPACPYETVEIVEGTEADFEGHTWYGGTILSQVNIFLGDQQMTKAEARTAVSNGIKASISTTNHFPEKVIAAAEPGYERSTHTGELLDIVRISVFRHRSDDPWDYVLVDIINDNLVATAEWRSPKLGDKGLSPLSRWGEEEIWEDENVKVYWSKSYFK